MKNDCFEWRDAPAAEFAVIGSPIHHSLSPQMHSAGYAACGLSAKYVAIHVPVGEVPLALDHLAGLGYRGVNVTVPHKEAAFEWAHAYSPVATDLGVCNTLEMQSRTGHNTDVAGILACVQYLSLGKPRVLVLGAGGSGRAAVYALAKAGLHVSLWNRTQERAVQLADSLSVPINIVDTPNLAEIDLIVNTTSVSLSGHSLPLDWSVATLDLVVFDLAYSEGLTPLLRDAQQHDHAVLDGRRMLMEQGAAAFEIWWERPAPREAMLEAIL